MNNIIATDKQIEQILRQIIVIPEQIVDGIVIIDMADTARFVNNSWAAMHGYTITNGLIGRHISTFHTKEQMKTLVADFIEEAKRRGQLAGPIEHVRDNGTVFCSQTKMTTAKDKNGKTIGLIIFAANSDGYGQRQHHPENQTTANQQLQNQINKQKQAENARKEDNNQFEQRLSEHKLQLTAIEKQLQQQITQRRQAEQQLAQFRSIVHKHL